MANKKNWLRILAIVLVFGMTVVLVYSCSTSPGTYQDNEYFDPTEAINLVMAIERSSSNITARVSENTRVALFNISSNEYSFLTEYVIEEISVILVNEASLIVLAREYRDVIEAEQRFQLSGNVRDEDIISLGRNHGASVVVSCSVTGEGDFRRLRVRALEVETGRILSLTSHAIIDFDEVTRTMTSVQQQPTISGTYLYDVNYHITFRGNSFTGLWSTTPVSGTFTASDNRLTLNRVDGITWNWIIVNENTIKDHDGDNWNKGDFQTSVQQPLTLSQAHGLFIERVGQINANLFPQHRFTWDNATQTLVFRSRTRDFSGTSWGLVGSPISFYKEMEVWFHDRSIEGAEWRYVYISADAWFQLGSPSPSITNPTMSNWFSTAVSNNDIVDLGINGVFNTLVHFESLGVNSRYDFRRGNGGNAILTVRSIQ